MNTQHFQFSCFIDDFLKIKKKILRLYTHIGRISSAVADYFFLNYLNICNKNIVTIAILKYKYERYLSDKTMIH